MTNSISFSMMWDHYGSDIAHFVLELCKQSHLVYLVAIVLALTFLRKRVAATLFSIPRLIREMRDAGIRRVGGLEIEANVDAAKEKRIGDFAPASEAKVTAADTLRINIDELTRNAVLHVARSFPESARRALSFDVAINIFGKKTYADAFIECHPDGTSDSFFEVKSISDKGTPDWKAVMRKYTDFLNSYKECLGRKTKGYLIVVIRDGYQGDALHAMIDAIIDKTDDIEIKFVFETDLKK